MYVAGWALLYQKKVLQFTPAAPIPQVGELQPTFPRTTFNPLPALFNAPRIKAPPFTSSLVVGVLIPMPMLLVVGFWKIAELPRLVLLVQRAQSVKKRNLKYQIRPDNRDSHHLSP